MIILMVFIFIWDVDVLLDRSLIFILLIFVKRLMAFFMDILSIFMILFWIFIAISFVTNFKNLNLFEKDKGFAC